MSTTSSPPFSSDGTYQGHKVISGTNTESIERLITDKEYNIIALGGFGTTLTLAEGVTVTPKTANVSNAIMIKYSSDGEYISHYMLGTTSSSNDNKFTTAVSTEDGLLIGGWFYSSNIDIDGDGTNETTNKGTSDGVLIKLKDDGNVVSVEWGKTIGGTSYDTASGVAQLKDGTYVAAGSFDSTTLTVDDKANALTKSGFTDGYTAAFGNVVKAAAVPQLQEIEVENELKK